MFLFFRPPIYGSAIVERKSVDFPSEGGLVAVGYAYLDVQIDGRRGVDG
jgi:hypothetical protein